MGLNEIIKIGSRIKECREQAQIKQKEMAQILEIPISTYSNYENDNREPPLEIIEKIAKVFSITPFQLIGAEYLDMKYPDIAKEVKEYEGLIDYLRSLGYVVEDVAEPSPIPSEKLPEELKTECCSEGYYEGETHSVSISKGENFEIILSEKEFQDFQERIKNTVGGEFALYQRKQK